MDLACLSSTIVPLPGAEKLVRHLHSHRIPMALATGSRRKNYLLKTQHLADLFGYFGDRVVCGDDLTDGMKGKPEPDIFLMAAREKLGLNVGNAQGICTDAEKEARSKVLVFEDGISGLQSAKRAGMSGEDSLAIQQKANLRIVSSCLGTRCWHRRR
jgi:pseudouridine 5'-phosphatase